ncbi:MAG TPA: hypothetical protein VG273_23360 [Bryobacteraceae bacterium]|jgi:hypothetical protein|nr:hypothetical protein [Bryobacteraceae bacterium]
MKPLPAPPVPGNTEWERFDNAMRKALTVPEKAIQAERERMKAEREGKRAKKRS